MSEKIPNFDDGMIEWAVNALSMMSTSTATHAFLTVYHSYNDVKYGSPEEIYDKIYYEGCA